MKRKKTRVRTAAEQEALEAKKASRKARLQKLGRWTRHLVVAAAIVTLLIAWGVALFPKTVNRNDSLDVARTFLHEVQQGHSHKAYILTSDQYHKVVKEADFSNNFMTSLNEELASTEAELFSTSTPPGGKVDGKEEVRYLFNVRSDGNKADFEVTMLLVKDTGGWGIDSVNSMRGLAKRGGGQQNQSQQPKAQDNTQNNTKTN